MNIIGAKHLHSARHRPEHWSYISATAGGVAGLLLLPFLPHAQAIQTLIAVLLLFAILVVTPLALALVTPPPGNRRRAWLYHTARYYQPIAAALTASAFVLPASTYAALLGSSWLLLTGLVALIGLTRLLTRGTLRAEELCINVGLLFLPIGGLWLVLSRLGAHPLGFGDTIVLLTAVHFHYAGFAIPILAGLAGRMLIHYRPAIQKLFRLTTIGIITGIPLVALGITFSRVLEVAAVFLLASSLLVLALLIIVAVVPRLDRRITRFLLTLSALASVATMLLAGAYATGSFTGLVITIPQMVLAHGVVNAFGLVLCGLLAWTIHAAAREPQ
jgi:hypothetical protein